MTEKSCGFNKICFRKWTMGKEGCYCSFDRLAIKKNCSGISQRRIVNVLNEYPHKFKMPVRGTLGSKLDEGKCSPSQQHQIYSNNQSLQQGQYFVKQSETKFQKRYELDQGWMNAVFCVNNSRDIQLSSQMDRRRKLYRTFGRKMIERKQYNFHPINRFEPEQKCWRKLNSKFIKSIADANINSSQRNQNKQHQYVLQTKKQQIKQRKNLTERPNQWMQTIKTIREQIEKYKHKRHNSRHCQIIINRINTQNYQINKNSREPTRCEKQRIIQTKHLTQLKFNVGKRKSQMLKIGESLSPRKEEIGLDPWSTTEVKMVEDINESL